MTPQKKQDFNKMDEVESLVVLTLLQTGPFHLNKTTAKLAVVLFKWNGPVCMWQTDLNQFQWKTKMQIIAESLIFWQ